MAFAPAAALAERTTTSSPAFSPLRICVEVSPTTPVCTRCVVRLVPCTSVTLPPCTAWLGTVTPLASETTMSAVALIPALSLEPVCERRSVTG